MRKIKEVLRLKHECGISEREIARICQVSQSRAADYLRRAVAAGTNWTEASALTESELNERLFPAQSVPVPAQRPPPNSFNLICPVIGVQSMFLFTQIMQDSEHLSSTMTIQAADDLCLD